VTDPVFGVRWRDAVRAVCDSVFAAAAVGFEWNSGSTWDTDHPALLWEADPLLFAARYPDSGIEDSYGDQWPAPCIDYWVYVDPDSSTAHLAVEGFSEPDRDLALSGDGARDGAMLAEVFASILRLDPPEHR
jgi:hypothetical protein